MPLTPSRLRADIYKILDRVAETGIPVKIRCGGKLLKIVAAEAGAPARTSLLEVRPRVLVGDPERLVHVDWSKEWKL